MCNNLMFIVLKSKRIIVLNNNFFWKFFVMHFYVIQPIYLCLHALQLTYELLQFSNKLIVIFLIVSGRVIVR